MNKELYSKEAEDSLVGSVFINPDIFFGLSEIVKSSSFKIDKNRWVWESFERLYEQKISIDPLTVSDDLERHKKLADVGGQSYITSLISQVPTSNNAESYARIVYKFSQDRAMLSFANNIANLAHDGKATEKKIRLIKEQLDEIENNVNVDDDFQPLSQLLDEVYEEALEREKDPKEVWGIPTGLNLLDKETGGQQGGELTFWVGEPGVGKTWLLTGIALEMSKNCPGGFLSMELKKQNIARRILSGVSGVHTKSMRSGIGIDWEKINSAVEENESLPLFLMYRSITSGQLYHIVRQAKRKYGFGFVVIDYAMLFVDSAKDETERTAIISKNLKNIATTFDVSVNCIHSVVKTGMDAAKDDSVSKSYMRGSGQQIHDADNVYFLTKYKQTDEKDGFLREEQTKRMATLWCKKGRELESSDFNIHLKRKENSPFFEEYDRNQAMRERGLL